MKQDQGEAQGSEDVVFSLQHHMALCAMLLVAHEGSGAVGPEPGTIRPVDQVILGVRPGSPGHGTT